jgi:uncharacterized protein
MLHTDHEKDSAVKEWLPLMKKYTKTRFIIAHGGKDHWRDAIEAAKQLSNVYVDTSTISLFRSGMILKGEGIKKVVFGSDIPYSHF